MIKPSLFHFTVFLGICHVHATLFGASPRQSVLTGFSGLISSQHQKENEEDVHLNFHGSNPHLSEDNPQRLLTCPPHHINMPHGFMQPCKSLSTRIPLS